MFFATQLRGDTPEIRILPDTTGALIVKRRFESSVWAEADAQIRTPSEAAWKLYKTGEIHNAIHGIASSWLSAFKFPKPSDGTGKFSFMDHPNLCKRWTQARILLGAGIRLIGKLREIGFERSVSLGKCIPTRQTHPIALSIASPEGFQWFQREPWCLGMRSPRGRLEVAPSNSHAAPQRTMDLWLYHGLIVTTVVN